MFRTSLASRIFEFNIFNWFYVIVKSTRKRKRKPYFNNSQGNL